MRRLNAIGTAIAGALIAILAPIAASADPRPAISRDEILTAALRSPSAQPGDRPARLIHATPATRPVLAGQPLQTTQVTRSVQPIRVAAAPADLSVRMSASPSGRVRLGDLLDYAIRVGNGGTAAAKNVKVAVALPVGLAVIGATPDGCAEQGSQVVICGFRSLAPGAPAEISVGTVVKGDASGDLRTTAKVSASTPDLTPADNEASATNSVERGTDLAVKLAVPEQAEAGGLFTMRATVVNHGAIKARNVRLGVGIERSTFVTLGAGCSRKDQTHSRCDLGRLAPGDKMTVTFQARVARTATGILNDFAATVSADPGETRPDDNVAITLVKVLDSTVPSTALLPATGSDSVFLGNLAVLLVGTGGLLLVAARPRRTAPRQLRGLRRTAHRRAHGHSA